jgi:predicted DNA-binding transcriptional regulator AlpA
MAPLLSGSDLRSLLGISSSTLDRWIKEGRIPKPDYRFGQRSPRWSREALSSLLGSSSFSL